MFQKGKQSSRVSVFSLEFAFILVSLGGYLLTPGILASSAFGHGDPDDLREPCSIPGLIIAAKQDTEVGYKDQFDLMEKYINSTYCAVDRAGHNLQIEQPEIFESLVKNWLLTH